MAIIPGFKEEACTSSEKSYLVQSKVYCQIFLRKCLEIGPNSPDQKQIANFILELESAHPLGSIFDEIKFGHVFFDY